MGYARVSKGSGAAKFSFQLRGIKIQSVDQAKSGHQLMGVVQSCVSDLHRLSDGGVQTTKLYLKACNSLHESGGEDRQAGAKDREDEVQEGVYMMNLTM